MNKTDVLNSIVNNEYLIMDNEHKLMCIFDEELAKDHGMRVLKRLYVIQGDGDTVKALNVEKMIKNLTDALLHTIDPRVLLTKVLEQTPPPDLIKADEIVRAHPDAAKRAKPRDGCFYIDLENPQPGEPGVPLYIRL